MEYICIHLQITHFLIVVTLKMVHAILPYFDPELLQLSHFIKHGRTDPLPIALFNRCIT